MSQNARQAENAVASGQELARAGAFPIGLLRHFSNRLSLANRILAVNIIVILMFVGGLLFLDNYRERLFAERREDVQSTAQLLAMLSDELTRDAFIEVIGREIALNKSRIRIFDPDGQPLYDSFDEGPPAYVLRSAADEDFIKDTARFLDRLVDAFLFKGQPPQYREPEEARRQAWPIFENVMPERPQSMLYYSGDFTPVVVGAAESGEGLSVLVTRNPRSVRRLVRAERFNIFLYAGGVILIAIALSLFLARTLVNPLRELTRAAIKVRRGRERQVMVPRMPERRDEIGLLSRATADMTESLRDRIDATEAFAADVAHEVKNPLASLRSALESLRQIEDPDLRAQLLAVAEDDVRRMDRMINDISDASRVDSELSRTRFEPVDIGRMIEQIVSGREARESSLQGRKNVKLAFARPRLGSTIVLGEDMRLARVIDNIIDNAISFSPHGGLVEIIATETGDDVLIRVRDEGPGVPESERETIFNRFYSNRPADHALDGEDSARGGMRHSGLGLAICRTIIEAHQGSVSVHDRDDGRLGAVFELRLPTLRSEQIP